MKRIPLFATSASLVLAVSVALALLGVATNFNASRFDLASPIICWCGGLGQLVRFSHPLQTDG